MSIGKVESPLYTPCVIKSVLSATTKDRNEKAYIVPYGALSFALDKCP